ncbi:MAG: sulfatase [Pirellulales bacterium]
MRNTTCPVLFCLLTFLIPVGELFAAEASSAATKPNIVFILADDLGINDLGCYGRRDHRTPNLDRLASQGMRFTSAYCAQPICSASRAAILTGKAPARLHLTTYLPGRPDCVSQKLLHPVIPQQLPLAEKTLAEYLKEAGYATACIGKWHLGGRGFGPEDQGFDVVHPGRANTTPSATEGGKGEYDLTAASEKFLEANRDRPFFLHLCHNTPHIPYKAKAELVAKNAAAFEPVYAATIETLDDTVGLLLAKLDALGLAANTLVVFTSDNGGLHVPEGPHSRITHNTPFRAGKGFLYEGGLRIPLLVRWPGRVPAGRIVDEPVINTDWLPTLLDLAGRPAPAGLDGVSIAGLLAGGSAPARLFYWHFPHYTNQGSRPAGAVRDGRWKLVEHYEDGRVELFDLAKDVGETTDLAARQPQTAQRLRAALDTWRKSVGAQTNAVNPNFDAARHRALYVDFDPSTYNAGITDRSVAERVLRWRRAMDAVVSMRP